jgi:hypothetical protein
MLKQKNNYHEVFLALELFVCVCKDVISLDCCGDSFFSFRETWNWRIRVVDLSRDQKVSE